MIASIFIPALLGVSFGYVCAKLIIKRQNRKSLKENQNYGRVIIDPNTTETTNFTNEKKQFNSEDVNTWAEEYDKTIVVTEEMIKETMLDIVFEYLCNIRYCKDYDYDEMRKTANVIHNMPTYIKDLKNFNTSLYSMHDTAEYYIDYAKELKIKSERYLCSECSFGFAVATADKFRLLGHLLSNYDNSSKVLK